MTLLEFAQGPALRFSLIVLIFGTAFRVVGIFMLDRKKDFSEKSQKNAWMGGLAAILVKNKPQKVTRDRHLFPFILAMLYHVGFFLIFFFGTPHMLFWSGVVDFSWPTLPPVFIHFLSFVSIAALLAVLYRRLTNPVLRLLSNFDDYFSWFVTFLPFVTGVMAFFHFGGRYETILAIHILSIALLFIWLPFGKLGHSFLMLFSRGITGAMMTARGTKYH